jgi:hypothetical protein
MGRPFETELQGVNDTLNWAFNQNVEDLKRTVLAHSDKPFYIVGSGGSFSACYYAAELLQFHGYMAKAITPLALHQNRIKIFRSNLIFISASGKNTDIISSFESALSQDPNLVISITLKLNSALKKLSDQFSVARHYEYELPAGKDGFLATNSLVAFFVLLNKAISSERDREPLSNIDRDQSTVIKHFAKKNAAKKSFIVLYGGWSSSVAVDLESKFSEAALGNVLLSDYRNFGHGRHHWFDKQSKDSVIILLSTPAEDKLADKTISILPKSIPHLKLFVDDTTSMASISLLIQAFHFVNEIGKGKKIDPGRPGVPAYGSKLYNLRYKTLVKARNNVSLKHYLAISRKVESPELLNSEDLNTWNTGLENFLQILSSTKFGGIIFDYDGTLCSAENRFTGMSSEVSNEVTRILEKGFVIGVATGRGKSVREDFQKQIPEQYWDQIVIAYYNGADTGMLRNSNLPDVKNPPHPTLQHIAEHVGKHPLIGTKLKIELRPFQLTIKITDIIEWKYARRILAHLLMSLNLSDIQMLESSHSCDIVIKSKASKLNILAECKEVASRLNCPPEFLCIGDRGQWPGNDFELLSHKFSLSVDEVSPDIHSCWNFAEAGKRNTEATLDYLSKIQWSKQDRSFSLHL